MKQYITTPSTLILLVCCLTAAFNLQANTNEKGRKVDVLMERSGLTRAIQALPVSLEAMAQQQIQGAENPEAEARFMGIFIDSLKPDILLNDTAVYIHQNASEADLQKFLDWLDTDLAIRAVTAESQSTEPDFEQKLMAYAVQIEKTPPSQARQAAVKHYVDASGVVDQGVTMMVGMVTAMFEATKARDPENIELAKALDAQLVQMPSMMRANFEQHMILTSLYLYRDLSVEELNQYASFYDKSVGKKYVKVMIGAIGHSFNMWHKSIVNQIIPES